MPEADDPPVPVEGTANPPPETFQPETVAAEIGAKLSARSRHVCLFLGAGASKAAGLPDLAGLQAKVMEVLEGEQKGITGKLLEGRNLEAALSRLRRIEALLDDDDAEFEGLKRASVRELDGQICAAIVAAVDTTGANLEPFIRLGSWAARSDYHHPIEIFTVNYDLLIEQGFERVGAPYFDGFVGNLRARFRSDLIDQSAAGIPATFARVWKLHGATNWAFDELDGTRQIVRLGVPVNKDAAAIYPSDAKYDDSRRVPFVVLMDRLRRAVSEPETIVLVSGYSFGDQHLNEILFDAAMRQPRFELLTLCFGEIPEALTQHATRTRNITVLSADDAIIAGERRRWAAAPTISGVFEEKFLLGDFDRLSAFLAREKVTSDA